jgi:hypothetical protein
MPNRSTSNAALLDLQSCKRIFSPLQKKCMQYKQGMQVLENDKIQIQTGCRGAIEYHDMLAAG